jgi:hypothetical protein
VSPFRAQRSEPLEGTGERSETRGGNCYRRSCME